MRRGGRPNREFVNGMNRREVSLRQQDTPPAQAPHIDLRVRRYLLDVGSEQYACNEFLKEVGRENRAAGYLRGLGSIAITLAPSTVVNAMLREGYPNDYHHPTRKLRLFRRAKSEIRNYLQSAGNLYGEQKAFQMSAEREASSISGDSQPVTSVISIEDEDKLLSHAFGEARLAVKGIELYGNGKKYGFDMSLDHDDILRTEREGLRSQFRSMGLDVSMYRGDFGRHQASFYVLFDHVGIVPLEYDEAKIPKTLLFEPPTVQELTVPVEK